MNAEAQHELAFAFYHSTSLLDFEASLRARMPKSSLKFWVANTDFTFEKLETGTEPAMVVPGQALNTACSEQ